MSYLDPIIRAAKKSAVVRDGDFESNGILMCGECKGAKQASVNIGGERHVVPCMCECEQKRWEDQRSKERAEDERLRIKALRTAGLHDKSIEVMRFENDDGHNTKALNMAKRYVDAWSEVRANNIGMLLWGDTGNGKTFTAGCIANALIGRGVPVLMTSFPRILSALNGMFNQDKAAYIDNMSHYPLLILDDLGAERETSYGAEQVYSVIDARYKAKKPLIVTTNLSLGEVQNPKSMDYKRIYDRVLEMCTPFKYAGRSKRETIAAAKLETVKRIVGGG